VLSQWLTEADRLGAKKDVVHQVKVEGRPLGC
jgi:hypothetical protein